MLFTCIQLFPAEVEKPHLYGFNFISHEVLAKKKSTKTCIYRSTGIILESQCT